MTELTIRTASRDEFSTAVDWAAAEGWNPGLDDLDGFHATDPNGFIMGFMNGTPVSSISVVKYAGGFGFLGFYIVHPAHRGSGFGIATWNAGMAYLSDSIVGLDGVVDQQDNYRKSGFVLAGRNVRHAGVPGSLEAVATDCQVRAINTNELAAVTDYDARHFAVRRNAFIGEWVSPQDGRTQRHSRIAIRDGEIAGIVTARACRTGYKIGPLFAEDENTAAVLFDAIVKTLPENCEVALDTPNDNPAAVALATRAGLKPVFETARMYCGTDPALPLHKIYGVTTFELG